MSRPVLALIVVGAFLVGLVAFAPAGAALALADATRTGLSAARAEGLVWNGRLVQARLGGVPLGDLDVRLEPLALLTGTLRLHAAGTQGAFQGSAVLVRRGRAFGLEAVQGEAPLSLIRTVTPLPGALKLDDVSARFEDGRCVSAAGRASTIAPATGGLLVMPPLTGTARCEAGALAFPLQGQGPAGGVAVKLTIAGDGRYQAETRVSTSDPAVGSSLRLAGFAAAGGAQVRRDEGRLWR